MMYGLKATHLKMWRWNGLADGGRKQTLLISFRFLGAIIVILGYTEVCTGMRSSKEDDSSHPVSRPTRQEHSPEERLYEFLMRNYNHDVRPILNDSLPVVVNFSISISQLIDVDERNQIMTTSVWLRHVWNDTYLRWNPHHFDGINQIVLPSDRLWRPDILLYNNADGHFDVQYLTNAIVNHTGNVFWQPPAIYKSACRINIHHFPFDEQSCKMKFGPWSHDSSKIDMISEKEHASQDDYWPNGEWEIMANPAQRSVIDYPCCPNEYYVDVTFHFILHRKPLFYVVTLVIPCLLISFLTILVFYLPSDAQEKITLSVSVLLALIVFLLLIPNLIPPTSTTLPLIGRYMLFTMVLVTLSITITVFVINMHYRSARTHDISDWIRLIFIDILPVLLRVNRPTQEKLGGSKKEHSIIKLINLLGTAIRKKEVREVRPTTYILDSVSPSFFEEIEDKVREFDEAMENKRLHKECLEIIDNVEVIAKHMQKKDWEDETNEEWKIVAIVIDRLFLWVFSIVYLFGTFGIFWQAEMLREPEGHHGIQHYDQPIEVENSSFEDLVRKGIFRNVTGIVRS